jgi:hypothetical protein
MSQQDVHPSQSSSHFAARRPWVAPRVDTLPPLTDLTLQTGAIIGDCGPSDPSSCFG